MSYIRHKTGTYPQVIQSKMIAIKVIHIPLGGLLRSLEEPNGLVCARVLNQVIHRVSGCYHFNSQVVDNYDVDCLA